MKSKRNSKYHAGGNVPTPTGQVPHPRIRGRGTRTSDERLRRRQEIAARKELAKLKAKAKSTGAKQLNTQPVPPALEKFFRDQALEMARQQRARQQIMEPSRVPSRIDRARSYVMPRQYVERVIRARRQNTPSPIQQPRPVRGATPVQATPQPMPMPAQRTDSRGQPMGTPQIAPPGPVRTPNRRTAKRSTGMPRRRRRR